MARGFYDGSLTIFKKPNKKRPGVHSKCKHTDHKTGKYYCGTKYKGQGK